MVSGIVDVNMLENGWYCRTAVTDLNIHFSPLWKCFWFVSSLLLLSKWPSLSYSGCSVSVQNEWEWDNGLSEHHFQVFCFSLFLCKSNNWGVICPGCLSPCLVLMNTVLLECMEGICCCVTHQIKGKIMLQKSICLWCFVDIKGN